MMRQRSLNRLLRLRSLLEGVSRLELEARLQELAQVESALARSEQAIREMRERRFSGAAQGESADWLEAQSVGEWVAWERGVFEKARRKKSEEVNAAKAVYLERRKERSQVESVIEAGEAETAMERGRREQRELDDWFNRRSRSNPPA